MSAIKEFHHDEIEKGMRESEAKKRDYPILFDTYMVKAILSGTKIQTSRLFRSPLSKKMEPAHEIWHDGGEWIARKKNGQCYKQKIVCPYGEIGDLLWVKETTIFNKNSKSYWPVSLGYSKTSDYEEKIPSIHMPKSAARLWLEITDIKAQRIQTVSEQDAIEEGCGVAKIFGFGDIGQSNHREGFFAKWITIYGLESYHENPWIWALKFKVL
jgi:hypothetical protein